MSLETDLARLERQVLGIVRVSGFIDAADALRRLLAAESTEIRDRVLRLVAPRIGRDLAAAVSAAYNLGIADAERIIGEGRVLGVADVAPVELTLAARATERAIADEIAKARALAAVYADPETMLAPVSKARTILQRDVATLVNRAGNAGTTAVADAAKIPTVWVAETNACVTCLAYSGIIAAPGEDFPAGLSYGRTSSMTTPTKYPPAHPNCRCFVEPLNDPSYAAALRREADRSVLRGFSLESESMKTRVDAAERLIERGVDAPKSVVAFARRAVKAGEFPTRGRP
jgi:hypothetical protein